MAANIIRAQVVLNQIGVGSETFGDIDALDAAID